MGTLIPRANAELSMGRGTRPKIARHENSVSRCVDYFNGHIADCTDRNTSANVTASAKPAEQVN